MAVLASVIDHIGITSNDPSNGSLYTIHEWIQLSESISIKPTHAAQCSITPRIHGSTFVYRKMPNMLLAAAVSGDMAWPFKLFTHLLGSRWGGWTAGEELSTN